MSALLELTQRYIAVAIGNTINVFCRNTAKLLFKYECNEDEEKNNDHNGNGAIIITHIKYSLKHDCFIIATNNKRIRTLIQDKDNNNNGNMYKLCQFKKMDKKISSIALSPTNDEQTEEFLICADKFGVIFMFLLPNLKVKFDGSGHLAIISHITFDSSGKYLMSCDKDFKIRISRFPSLFIIDGFCYGHTEAVTKCCTIENKYILSGSCDGTIRFWSIPFGKQLSIIKV